MLYQADFLANMADGLRRALPQWGFSESSDLTLLNISENATFRLMDRASGRILIFRVHRPGYHSETEILSELAWVEALRADRVVQTARLVPALDGSLLCSFHDGGQSRHVVASEFIPGQEPSPGADLASWFERLGSITARLHMQSRGWRRPPWFQRKSWTYETILGDHPHWGHWRAALGLEEPGAGLLLRVQTLLRQQLAAYGVGASRFGLIHADLRLANLLVDGDRMSVIDFDDCGFSWFGFDFAAAISFIEHEPYIPSLKQAWLSGYRKVAALDADDERAIDVFIMLRRLQITSWIASHAETPTAQAMGAPYTAGTVAMAEAYLQQHG